VDEGRRIGGDDEGDLLLLFRCGCCSAGGDGEGDFSTIESGSTWAEFLLLLAFPINLSLPPRLADLERSMSWIFFSSTRSSSLSSKETPTTGKMVPLLLTLLLLVSSSVSMFLLLPISISSSPSSVILIGSGFFKADRPDVVVGDEVDADEDDDERVDVVDRVGDDD
jgi:hypothetical protein